jgi:hypothetical protein
VGFKPDVFTKDQLDRLSPYIGKLISGDLSYFVATHYMYFPLFTCEVKCGGIALQTADCQNAQSMTMAARAIVGLYRIIGREKELHRELLAFSISHDHQSVRILGEYPIISDGQDTKYYRHLIRHLSFVDRDDEQRWAAHRFTKNLYDLWMPKHLERIRSIIDQLPSSYDNISYQLSQDNNMA